MIRLNWETPDFKPPQKFHCTIHFAWRTGWCPLHRPPMTRPAIERCIWIFIVALIATFLWTVAKVLAMLGWF